jgi:hypothetical protein
MYSRSFVWSSSLIPTSIHKPFPIELMIVPFTNDQNLVNLPLTDARLTFWMTTRIPIVTLYH